MPWTTIPTPRSRITPRNDAALGNGPLVLYWMTAARRLRHHFGLQHAAEQASHLDKTLVILEPLRVDHPHASARFHHVVLDGMADHHADTHDQPVLYHPYVERAPGAGRGLLAAYGKQSALIVTDDYPTFFIPHMQVAAARALDIPLVAVDSNGLLPMSATEGPHKTAYAFRRWAQQALQDEIHRFPHDDPLTASAPPEPRREAARVVDRIMTEWPGVTPDELEQRDWVDELPIDHDVPRVTDTPGGPRAAEDQLDTFVTRVQDYATRHNEPDQDATSGLSPYLHFGHISSHEVVRTLLDDEGWDPDDLGTPQKGKRTGFWRCSEGLDAFLDQLVTWRELGYHHCHHVPNHTDYATLPDWARTTLDDHRTDPRHTYTLDQLEHAHTEDEIWNAAQTELRTAGRIHNYLRMLWGKLILQWSPTPEEALRRMILLNDRYALDGRDPNSYSGIFWVLGRFDRAWGPERPIFGKVRYMTSANTRRKYKLARYLARWQPDPQPSTDEDAS